MTKTKYREILRLKSLDLSQQNIANSYNVSQKTVSRIEYSSRKNNRLKRRIRNAGFDQTEASIININYSSGRKLNKELINRLATCEYISDHQILFITGATGYGKTYMACAFGMEAYKQYFNTRYARLCDLLIDLEIARSTVTTRR